MGADLQLRLQAGGTLSNLVSSLAAWSGSSDDERSRGASLALGGLRPHCGPTADPHLCVLLHWQGEPYTTHTHTHIHTHTFFN